MMQIDVDYAVMSLPELRVECSHPRYRMRAHDCNEVIGMAGMSIFRSQQFTPTSPVVAIHSALVPAKRTPMVPTSNNPALAAAG